MRRSLAIAGAAVAVCAAAGPLHAQGSSVDQQSACMTGRVGAGIAHPCDDASAVYFSPAGLVMHPGAVSIGVSLVNSSNEFQYDATADPSRTVIHRDAETVPVPQVFASYRVNPRVAVGIGAWAPFGLGLEWPVCPVDNPGCTGENFEGRFTGYDNSLRAVYIQPTVSFAAIPDRLLLGVGVDYVTSSIEVHRRGDAPTAGLAGVDVADAALEGDGTGVTAHVGAMLKITPRTWIGARYLHSVSVDMDGTADFEQVPVNTVVDALLAPQFVDGGPLGDQGISTEVEFPWQFVVGISHQATDQLNLMFDYQRTGWSAFDAFDIDFENATAANQVLTLNYRDANTFRFAAQYDWNERLTLRGGFRYNTAATPRATPFLPEGERNYYTAGIGYAITPKLSADFGYQFIHQPDRRGAVRPSGPEVGVYSAKGQIFGFTLAYRFGK
ncbi:MAG TPA: outer membrane protein transport protein [Longimicrobium sp.]|nr:outer membrane protein transport protein [Longimicrobium sp.]